MPRPVPPRAYWVWLGGVVWTVLGVSVLSFGAVWVASGYGGQAASAALLVVTVPRLLLTAVGGMLVDRWGSWRIMIRSDLIMAVVTGLAGVIAVLAGSPLWLALSIGVALGTVDGFYQPASGALPRVLVPPDALPRAIAARQSVTQVAAFAGPGVGGAVVGTWGLGAAGFVACAGFTIMATVLWRIRGAARPDARLGSSAPFCAGIVAGVALAWSDRTVRALLGLVVVLAGLVLPIVPLLVPLIGRESGWDAASTGWVAGAFAGGMMLVAFVVAARGGVRRAGLTAALAVPAISLPLGVLALADDLALAIAGAVLAGALTSLAATHVMPVIMAISPAEALGRIQALSLLAQAVPLVLATSVLGPLSDALGPQPVLGGCAIALACSGLAWLTSPWLRQARIPQSAA